MQRQTAIQNHPIKTQEALEIDIWLKLRLFKEMSFGQLCTLYKGFTPFDIKSALKALMSRHHVIKNNQNYTFVDHVPLF